ncbi:hypothetical protein V6N13_043718 [Hibiscus sabdariffa]
MLRAEAAAAYISKIISGSQPQGRAALEEAVWKMPLFKRTPFGLAKPPEDLEPSELVYRVRFTKEIFRDYHTELQKRSKDLAQKIALEEAVLRRSTRVRAPPRENPANAFLKYVNKWKED